MEVIIFDRIDEYKVKVLKLALLQLKKKYKWGQKGPDEFDCAGLTWYIYNELFGIDINFKGYGRSTTTMQMTSLYGVLNTINENSDKTIFINNLNVGDILFFHRQSFDFKKPTINNYYPGHCGLYIGNLKFIQASYPRKEVLISDFNDNEYWKKVLVGSKNIIKSIK